MEARQLGQSDIQITPIIMGLWQAGKEMWANIDDKQTTQAVRAAFDAGITTFDTAETSAKDIRKKYWHPQHRMCAIRSFNDF